MDRIKTNFGTQILLLCVALLVALPVRVYQYLHVIDPTNGFYNNWKNPTVFGLYGLCFLLIIAQVVLSAKGSKKTIYSMPEGKCTSVGIASLVMAIAFVAEGAYNAMRVYQIQKGILPVEQLVLGNNVGKSTLLFTALQAISAFVSAVWLFTLAASFLSGKKQKKQSKMLALFPILWAVARLMVAFTQTVSYRYVSELLFEMLMIIFFGMFAVAFAKFNVGTLETRVQMRLFGYGILSIFFAFLTAVPRYIILLMGRQDVLYRTIEAYEVTDLILPVFVASLLFAVAARKQYKSVEEYHAE